MPRYDYDQHKQARIDRLEERAEQKAQEADSLFSRAHQMADVIPFGQPILVGHHSEGRDRRYRARIDGTFRKAVETHEASKDLAARAVAAASNKAISSDDPNAIAKLKEKLASLEARQAHMTAVNKAHARFLKNPATLESSGLSEGVQNTIRNYKPAYSWEPHPFAPYQFQNNNGNMRRIKQRIEQLTRENAKQEAEPERADRRFMPLDVILRENTMANRLQLLFPGKPSDDVRASLKRLGFHWSRTEGAWQRQLNESARWQAEYLLKELNQTEVTE